MSLYQKPENIQSRWSTFENPQGIKGEAAQVNQGGKGHACENLAPGETKVLMDIDGCGLINRMWFTIDRRDPVILRSLRIDMYWDNAETPAVSAPFGDFFNMSQGRMAVMDTELFSSPEARSFNSYIKMPFAEHARITVTHESEGDILFFYEINYELMPALPADSLYFHAAWRRESPNTLGEDFRILPRVTGSGRFLGCNVSVIADKGYGDSWWGEGEVKVYLDGDTDWPTLAGTGTEDYIGTGWGQNFYVHRYQGCTVADNERKQWGFYRFHIPDPVWFDADCLVTIQAIGGAARPRVKELMEAGMPIKPVTNASGVHNGFTCLLDMDPVPVIDDPSLTDAWTNYFRCDDYAATAYFYLDKPENGLPALADVSQRAAGVADIDESKRADT